jgi:quinolinate synthase
MSLSGKQELIDRINRLRRERRAVILAHNYQIEEVQDIADFCGDSLDLSRRAAAADAEVIVFCGVHFMAETAAILSPKKTVLLPDLQAGCPMADMIDAACVRDLRSKHPDALVVTYVNSSAEVKAESDWCCTSSNAEKLVRNLPADRPIVFIPDQHLGEWVQKQTGRQLILWPGYCPTHRNLKPEHIHRMRRQHPDALVMVHPECRMEVCQLADAVLSTGGMIRLARENSAQKFAVGTEIGILHRLRRENPEKVFLPLSDRLVCPNMKRINLEKIARALETGQNRIVVDERIASAARRALERMLEVA